MLKERANENARAVEMRVLCSGVPLALILCSAPLEIGLRIYLTHCAAKKNDRLCNSAVSVAPDELYAAAPIQRFIRTCHKRGVRWAILSDLYGVWFPEVKHRWYDKPPGSLTDVEFRALLKDFDRKLAGYSEILFYRNPGRFHCMYDRLLKETSLKRRVTLISHLDEIV